jgi:hypothetical protein
MKEAARLIEFLEPTNAYGAAIPQRLLFWGSAQGSESGPDSMGALPYLDLHRERISKLIESTKRDFELVHIHANSFGGTDPIGDPLVVEITWKRKDMFVPIVPAKVLQHGGQAGDRPGFLGRDSQRAVKRGNRR